MNIKRVVLLFGIIVSIISPFSLYAGGKSDTGSQKAPDQPGVQELQPPPVLIIPAPEPEKITVMLAGTNEGLLSVSPAVPGAGRTTTTLWNGGSVKKIVPLDDGGKFTGWAIVGSAGVLVANDLHHWEQRNQGLPVKTVKIFQNGNKSFLQIVQELKDLEVDPADTQIMVTATKDRVYLSRNQGRSWTSLGAPQYQTNGIKAVAAAHLPGANGQSDLTVFLSHSVYGIHFIQPDRPGAHWTEISKGLEALETTGNTDEVSDIAVMLKAAPGETSAVPEIFVSQTFRRRIYRLDWNQKAFKLIWSDNNPFGTVDSLFPAQNGLYFLHEGTAASLDFSDYTIQKKPDYTEAIRKVSMQVKLNCSVLQENLGGDRFARIPLCELWLLDEVEPGQAQPVPESPAANKEGLYLPVNHAMDSNDLRRYYNTLQRAGLNMIVIDMKDDYGRLRFTPKNPAITAKGRVFRPLDLEVLLKDMKDRGIYTVARIVVFKDPVLAGRENNRFAVWDARNAIPWVGYRDSRRRTSTISDEERRNSLMRFFPSNEEGYEIVRSFYDENWVDPYSEEVWEYNAAIAEELHARGFDEIQFDYIRFPTDGDNLGHARYRWQDSGMDTESAILSFLRHVRSRVSAPISIDIYGANGWYRTGSRTGQEVELLAPWVDIICPMYYPNHFEQYFLAQQPAELRPWRIYFIGTLRNARIARGQVIVRPWTQAFYLNVSYDRQYYGGPLGTARDFVRREIEGVRQAGNGGFTHWNNSGRYEDIPDK